MREFDKMEDKMLQHSEGTFLVRVIASESREVN